MLLGLGCILFLCGLHIFKSIKENLLGCIGIKEDDYLMLEQKYDARA